MYIKVYNRNEKDYYLSKSVLGYYLSKSVLVCILAGTSAGKQAAHESSDSRNKMSCSGTLTFHMWGFWRGGGNGGYKGEQGVRGGG